MIPLSKSCLKKINRKFLKLHDEMKKMQNDVSGRFSAIEENLAEILSFIKKST